MRDQMSQTVETVTLLLETKRFKINKEQLINKSLYFATLFSTTYTDHRLSEHTINYEIPLTSFQDFIDWIYDENIIAHYKNNLGRLLVLLELSVLFAVDDLIKNITYTLEQYYLLPEEVLNIWLLAEELGLHLLRDLCLAICLDRFTELPLNLIIKLSRQNFLKLIGNANLRVANVNDPESYLLNIVQEWMKVNQDIIPLDILKKTGPKIFLSIISCDIFSSTVNDEFYIHCWDNNNLSEFTTFKYPNAITDNKNTIMGMQISVRGYNLYLIGGEFGIGSGRFNTNIWRYSLISKNWFFEVTMPCARRHMIAAIVQNTLILAGGVGHYRRKLRSLDIYNLHKGIWIKGEDIPMEFVTVPDHYVLDKKLIVFDRFKSPIMYIYNSELNEWIIVKTNQLSLNICDLHMTTSVMKFKAASCCIDNNRQDKLNLQTIVVIDADIYENLEHNRKILQKITAENFGTIEKDDCNIHFYFILSCNNLDENNMLICLTKQKCMLIRLKGNQKLQWNSISLQNPNKFSSLFAHSHTFFFNLMHPANLHDQSATKLNCTT
ncbi:uncharacterized protein LOC114932366 isoform X2 [Nylanderia fulva]|nr:uncharacterized protein LOC114932366 isoform X2 [Nylanderia fulva]